MPNSYFLVPMVDTEAPDGTTVKAAGVPMNLSWVEVGSPARDWLGRRRTVVRVYGTALELDMLADIARVVEMSVIEVEARLKGQTGRSYGKRLENLWKVG